MHGFKSLTILFHAMSSDICVIWSFFATIILGSNKLYQCQNENRKAIMWFTFPFVFRAFCVSYKTKNITQKIEGLLLFCEAVEINVGFSEKRHRWIPRTGSTREYSEPVGIMAVRSFRCTTQFNVSSHDRRASCSDGLLADIWQTQVISLKSCSSTARPDAYFCKMFTIP